MNYIEKMQLKHRQENNVLTSADLLPIDEVLAKGTIFRKLYETYKIIPKNPVPNSEQEKLMQEIQTYCIACIDMTLYLDVNPSDKDAIDLFNMIKDRKEESKKKYEQIYGPLSLKSETLKGIPWTWLISKWPWVGSED